MHTPRAEDLEPAAQPSSQMTATPTVFGEVAGGSASPPPDAPFLAQIEPTTEEDMHQIDPFLLQALNQPKDRLTILKLDYELENFINSKR